MESLCVIPARGGSKRIPHKNIRNFCGKPIISYSVRAALESALFDEVMVSTDDADIAQIARDFGAEVPFMRSASASDDYATTKDVLLEVLSQYRVRGKSFEVVCCLYPTAPFVTPDDLCKAMALLRETGADMVQPVAAFDFPPQRAFEMKGGTLSYWMPECCDARSQDLPVLYHDAGQFYFYRVESIDDDARTRRPLILNRARVQDIDDETDWALAEAKYLLNRKAV